MIRLSTRGGARRLRTGAVGCVILLSSVASACSARLFDPADIASVRLTCTPAPRGIRCRAVALSHHVADMPRDVTDHAVWASTEEAVTIRNGMLESTTPVTAWVEVRYQRRVARVQVRLRPGEAGRLLGSVRGHAYIEADGHLKRVAGVRVEIISGPDAGRSVNTDDEGEYDLVAVEPGSVVVRFQKAGYDVQDVSSEVLAGENIVNPLLVVGGRIGVRTLDRKTSI